MPVSIIGVLLFERSLDGLQFMVNISSYIYIFASRALGSPSYVLFQNPNARSGYCPSRACQLWGDGLFPELDSVVGFRKGGGMLSPIGMMKNVVLNPACDPACRAIGVKENKSINTCM